LGIITILTLIFVALIVYVYVGYPVLIFLLARLVKRTEPQQGATPKVSLIIAAYNEEEVIQEKIENSLKLNYPEGLLEIIIAADGSSDSTGEIANRYKEQGVVTLTSTERRGKSAALNRGVSLANGEILVFSDANAFYHEDTIHNIVKHFANERVGSVSGKKTVVQGDSTIGESEGFYWKYESTIKKMETKTNSTVAVVGEMFAIRKSIYPSIPEHVINDDAYLAMYVLANGYHVVYEPAAYSWETPAVSASEENIRRRRINAGRYQLMIEYFHLWRKIPPLGLFKLISHKFFRLLLPFFMALALFFNIIDVLFFDAPLIITLLLVAQIACYALAAIGYLGDKLSIKFLPAKIAYYIVSTNLAAVSGLITYLRRQHSVLWQKAQRASSQKT